MAALKYCNILKFYYLTQHFDRAAFTYEITVSLFPTPHPVIPTVLFEIQDYSGTMEQKVKRRKNNFCAQKVSVSCCYSRNPPKVLILVKLVQIYDDKHM